MQALISKTQDPFPILIQTLVKMGASEAGCRQQVEVRVADRLVSLTVTSTVKVR